MWSQITPRVGLELTMEGGGRHFICWYVKTQWFQFHVSKDDMSLCAWVHVCMLGVAGWSGESSKHTSGCVVWAKDTGQQERSDCEVFRNTITETEIFGVRPQLRQLWNRTRLQLQMQMAVCCSHTSSRSLPSTLSSQEETFSASSPSGLLGVYVLEM